MLSSNIGTASRLKKPPPGGLVDRQGGRHVDPEARPEAAAELMREWAAWFARNVRPLGM
jgi:hypothetical protein